LRGLLRVAFFELLDAFFDDFESLESPFSYTRPKRRAQGVTTSTQDKDTTSQRRISKKQPTMALSEKANEITRKEASKSKLAARHKSFLNSH